MTERREMSLSGEAWAVIVVALFGFLGSTSMLVMNLSIRSSISSAMRSQETHQNERMSKIEVLISEAKSTATREAAELKVDVANLRTKIAEANVTIYQQIMDSMDKMYANRQASELMHASNSKRLDMIETRLGSMEERLPV